MSNELKNQEILITCADNLTGFSKVSPIEFSEDRSSKMNCRKRQLEGENSNKILAAEKKVG